MFSIFKNFFAKQNNKLSIIKQKLISKKDIQYFIFFASILTVGMLIPYKIAYTITPSLNYRIFYIGSELSNVEKGDYVMFYLKSKYYGDKVQKVIKQIACDEGEKIENIGEEFWCNNNEFIGKAKKFSLKGEKLKQFTYNGVIPKGYIFVAGHHKDSFDSRYFGFIKKSEIIAKVYPIF